jgi:hypothetical protein
MTRQSPDDAPTLVALGVLAFIIADFTHEALGHGLMTLVVGGQPVMLTSTYFSSSGNWSRWIPAAGGLADLIAGLLCFTALCFLRQPAPRLRYFLILTEACNLLFAAGYPVYSGIAAFGDWAAVIAGLTPGWVWRTLLVALGGICYYLSLKLIAAQMAHFGGSDKPESLTRLRLITLIPFLAAQALAALAGAFNPRGWTNILTAALPAAAASFGITQIDHFPEARGTSITIVEGPLTRSKGWIAAALVLGSLFVSLLGPGISFATHP